MYLLVLNLHYFSHILNILSFSAYSTQLFYKKKILDPLKHENNTKITGLCSYRQITIQTTTGFNCNFILV